MVETLPMDVDPSSVALALKWHSALRAQDVATLWSLTDADYRLALTQWWMGLNPGVERDPSAGPGNRDSIAVRIAEGDHELSEQLLHVVGRDLAASLPWTSEAEVHVGTASRPIALDIEAVALFLATDVPDGRFEPGVPARSCVVTTRFSGDTRSVVGLNCIAVPGWPPRFDPLSASLGSVD